jgi:hypothetical protein
MITQKIKSHDDKRSSTWICSNFPTIIYFIDQSYMNPSEKTSVPNQSTFEIKHYIIHDEVQKGESGSPIHISTNEKISKDILVKLLSKMKEFVYSSWSSWR